MQKSNRTKFTTMMERQLIRDLKKIAIDEERSVADILEELCIVYVQDNKKSSINK